MERKAWEVMVAHEYRETERLRRYGDTCMMGRAAMSRLHLLWNMAKSCGIPGWEVL